MNRRTCSILGILCGACLLFFSCAGPFGNSGYYPGAESGITKVTTTITSPTTPGYNCPDQGNIMNSLTRFPDFTVCTSVSSPSDIAIHGTTNANSICIFPAQVIDSTHIYWKIDASTGGPMSFCAGVPGSTGSLQSGSAILASFPNTNYNAVYIVDQVNRDQMASCLVMGSAFCPADYDFGQFR